MEVIGDQREREARLLRALRVLDQRSRRVLFARQRVPEFDHHSNGYPLGAGPETTPSPTHAEPDGWVPSHGRSSGELDEGAFGIPKALEEATAVPGRKLGQVTVELTSTVPASAASIALVRNAVRGFADGWRVEGWAPKGFDAERSCDLALVFTELLTNAVLHSGSAAGDAVRVRLALDANGIHGSVTDPGRGFRSDVEARRPRVDGGLGLFIVGRLVRAWGVRQVPGGTEVWFDF
jgi:anti-sigma regulatory factor (Ser/Thr protein kinase)